MKRTIRLLESDLKHMISESVRRTLNEIGKTGVFNDNGEYMGYENHEDFGTEYDDNYSQFDSTDNWLDDLMDDLRCIAEEKVVELVKNIVESGKPLTVLYDAHRLANYPKEEYCYLEDDVIVYIKDTDDLIYDLYSGYNVPRYNLPPDMKEVKFEFGLRDICKKANIKLSSLHNNDEDTYNDFIDGNDYAQYRHFKNLGINDL